MKLVAYVGKDQENYGQISALINRMECDQVILVKDKSVADPFQNPKCKYINVDPTIDLLSFKNDIQTKLKPYLKEDFEVALSIASGNGKEHKALISSLLTAPVGIKLVAYTKNGIEYLT